MHYCKNCLRQVEDNLAFCPNCGARQYPEGETPPEVLKPQEHSFGQGETSAFPQFQESKTRKNPWLAALLNFFLPGLGYVYVGLGRDKSLFVFGILIFIAVSIGFYVPIFGAPAPSSTPIIPAIDLLELLLFLLPFAFAYDAYTRTEKMNRVPAKGNA